jgi:DNA-binding MarR family transcriptional regulator
VARPKPGLTALIVTRLTELAIAADHETAVKLHRLRLTVAQMRVLLALSDERVAQSALARTLHCDVSNLTSLLRRLERRRLITRSAADHDRRYKPVSLTLAGRRMQQRLLPIQAQVAGQLYGHLTRRQQRQLYDLVAQRG